MQFEDCALKTNVPAFCEPIRGSRKTTKTYFCQLIHKNCSYLWKILGWCRARNSFAYRLPSVEATEHSSSSWSSTSRRWWSDWILEMKRLSQEPFRAISTLVWWKVEEHNGERRRKQENILILYWSIRTTNSLSPSSSRSSGTQSHWFYTSGQCFFRIISSSTFIILDVQSGNTPSQIQDW